jgi:hypothetical protein
MVPLLLRGGAHGVVRLLAQPRVSWVVSAQLAWYLLGPRHGGEGGGRVDRWSIAVGDFC